MPKHDIEIIDMSNIISEKAITSSPKQKYNGTTF